MKSEQFTVYLVRHAQSENNAKPESQRIPDPAITDLGIRQALAFSRFASSLAPTHLYTSPFLRTLQTTAPMADALGIVPSVKADLYEQGGCYRGYRINDRTPEPGLNRSGIQSLHPNWIIDPSIDELGWNKHTSYEHLEEARARANRVSNWLVEQPWPKESRVMLVIHADFKIRMLEALLDRLDIEDQLGSVINTAWTSLKYSGGHWKLDRFNQYDHLESDMVSE
jgi:2,3-bisphosphoglycerate-dependent phosphoglycerate mutase